jgi:ParB-like chromosome segregation protein Spo0J
MPSSDSSEQWAPVIGRSLALIALHVAELDNKSISDRAAFLQTLGLPKEEIAAMLGSSAASIAELLRRGKKGEQGVQSSKAARKKSGGKRKASKT